MARVRINIKNESNLVNIESLKNGEIFKYEDGIYMKAYMFDDVESIAVNLSTGLACKYDTDKLVTYVNKAELNIEV